MSTGQPPLPSNAQWESSSNSSGTAAIQAQPENMEDKDVVNAGRVPVSEQLHPIRTKLGLNPKAPIHDDHDDIAHNELVWSRVRITLKEPFAEFWGTFIMVFFGNGSVAQVILSTGLQAAPGGNGYGAYNAISWGSV